LVKDITDMPDSEREEEDTDTIEEDPSIVGQKRKVDDAMDISLPYLLDAVVTVDDMLGKLPKFRYSNHDVCDEVKFSYLAEETYLTNTGEIGPLGKPIMELAQWITGLYNSDIMNLLDIQHFEHNKNVELYIKQLVTCVHRGILWMDRLVQIDVALIANITGLPTFGV